jgi:very-short-patch-repair endonuclease
MDDASAKQIAPVRSLRVTRRARAERAAHEQDGIMTRPQLYAVGLTRSEVRANVRAGRWRRVGRQCICIHRGPLSASARHRVAVLEAGPRAYLDGASALVEAGLKNFKVESVRVSVPRGARVYRRLPGVDIRQTRRWQADDVAAVGGVPRARPPVAAVRAGLWARTDREAALVLTMSVQQGVVSAEEIALEMLRVRRDKRRAYVHGVLHDLLDGVRSLGELDVARECRRRGLPEPTRQVLRRTGNGTYYLDVYWEQWKLVVEIDGIQHSWAQQVVGDAIRQNSLALRGDTVLRLPLLGLRVAPDEFFAQIEDALVSRGCELPGRRTA